jgi:hypothetical protein
MSLSPAGVIPTREAGPITALPQPGNFARCGKKGLDFRAISII